MNQGQQIPHQLPLGYDGVPSLGQPSAGQGHGSPPENSASATAVSGNAARSSRSAVTSCTPSSSASTANSQSYAEQSVWTGSPAQRVHRERRQFRDRYTTTMARVFAGGGRMRIAKALAGAVKLLGAAREAYNFQVYPWFPMGKEHP